MKIARSDAFIINQYSPVSKLNKSGHLIRIIFVFISAFGSSSVSVDFELTPLLGGKEQRDERNRLHPARRPVRWGQAEEQTMTGPRDEG